MANSDLAFGALQKPAKGSTYMAAKERRADRRDAEDAIMKQARQRDGNRCRWRTCTGKYRGLVLPIDICHNVHRGMGGNPKLDRTTRDQLVALCRKHHQAWDDGLIDLQPISDAGFDGLISFHEKHKETGVMQHVATEVRR